MNIRPIFFILLIALYVPYSLAGDSTVPATTSTADDESGDAQLEPQFPVEIQCDQPELKEMLTQHLPLIYYQRKEKLNKEQVGYLAEDAPNDALKMLKTEGYFNAKVSVKEQGKGYVVHVTLNERTTIEHVNVALLGDIVQDKNLGQYYKNAFLSWKLPVNAPFRQDDWSASKTSVLSAITRKKYPLAQFSQTQAVVNPNTHRANLTVNVDSKNPIYFGEIELSGNQRYPKNVILGLAQFQAGDEYDLDKLLDYQQALENDSHYSGASVQADFDRIHDARVPIKVVVSEVKRQKFEAGISFDSEYGVGGNLGYEHYNLFNRGFVGSTMWQMDKYQTTFALGVSQPRNSNGHYWTSNITYNRSTTQNLEKKSISTGLWHVRNRANIESRYGVEFLGEDSRLPGSRFNFGRSFATMLTASWKRQNITTTMRPQNGYYFDGKVGTTLGSVLSSAFMARVKGSAGMYFTPENVRLGTLVLRGELGYVYTNKNYESGDVPSSLMFRSGGASSIRGYELDSIGRQVWYRNAVLPERAMFTASTEYQIPIKKDFALALFHDMGGVAHTFQEMTLRHGTGLGVRWFSPAAPFSFDLAYGHHDKKLRWHISLGTRF